jgi:hypothetical protein
VQLEAEVVEVVNAKRSVVVRYRQNGVDREVEGRCVVLATPATVSHRVAVDLSADIRDALGKVVYGPYVSAAFLTDEATPQPWDAAYGIATPKRSFNIVLNQSSLVRGGETARGRRLPRDPLHRDGHPDRLLGRAGGREPARHRTPTTPIPRTPARRRLTSR